MRKLIFIILILVPWFTYSQEKDIYTILTVFDGVALRPSAFYNSSEISIERLKSSGLDQRDQGISANYELLGKTNYSLGLKYYRTLFAGFPILYAGLQPCMYSVNGKNGLNVRPELGFLYDPIWQHTVGLRLKLAYGYDIPVPNGKGYSYNRSVIELKVGITFNIHHSIVY